MTRPHTVSLTRSGYARRALLGAFMLVLVGACGDDGQVAADVVETAVDALDTVNPDTDITPDVDPDTTEDAALDVGPDVDLDAGPDVALDVGPDADTVVPSCPAGTEEAPDGNCVDCAPGFFGDGVVCAACPDGSVQPASGAASCIDCVPGTKDDGTEVCADVDECASGFLCADCVNTFGGYVCFGTEMVIDTSGGTVEAESPLFQGTTVTLPPGAVDDGTPIVVGMAERDVAKYPFVSAGIPVQFLPSPMVFNAPVLVSIPFYPERVGANYGVEDIRVLSRNDLTGETQVIMPQSVDVDGGLVWFETMSFSTKEVMVEQTPEDYQPPNGTCTGTGETLACTCNAGFSGSPPESECKSSETRLDGFIVFGPGGGASYFSAVRTGERQFHVEVPGTATTVTIQTTTRAAGATVAGPGSRTLPVGDTSLSYVITAPDGSTGTTTLTIRRQSTDVALVSLDVRNSVNGQLPLNEPLGGLAHTIGPIVNTTSSVRVSPTVSPTATVTPPFNVALEDGVTSVSFVINAEDLSVSATHTLTITRCAAGHAIVGGACVPCAAGTRPDDQGGCVACAAGRYQPLAGQAACLPCNCPVGNDCTSTPVCDPIAGCQSDNQPAVTICGDTTDDICTRPDTCDGSGVCLGNHEPDGQRCGGAAGPCELADVCQDGLCQDGGPRPAGTACGDDRDNTCTEPDTCTADGVCAPNHLECDCTASCHAFAEIQRTSCLAFVAANEPPTPLPAGFCDVLRDDSAASCIADACVAPVKACGDTCGDQEFLLEESCVGALGPDSWEAFCGDFVGTVRGDCQSNLAVCAQLPTSCVDRCDQLGAVLSDLNCDPRAGVGPPLRPSPLSCNPMHGGVIHTCNALVCGDTPVEDCGTLCTAVAAQVYEGCLQTADPAIYDGYCETLRDRDEADCLASTICELVQPTCTLTGDEICDGLDNDCNETIDDIVMDRAFDGSPSVCTFDPEIGDVGCGLFENLDGVHYAFVDVCVTVANPNTGCDGGPFEFALEVMSDGAGSGSAFVNSADDPEYCLTVPIDDARSVSVNAMPFSFCSVPPQITIAAELQGGICDAVCVPDGVERCDGVDNDCDGNVDGNTCNPNADVCLEACTQLAAAADPTCRAYVQANAAPQDLVDMFPPPFEDSFCGLVANTVGGECGARCGGSTDNGASFTDCGAFCEMNAMIALQVSMCDEANAGTYCAPLTAQLESNCKGGHTYCGAGGKVCATAIECDDGDVCTRDLCLPGEGTRTFDGPTAPWVDTQSATLVSFDVRDSATIVDLDVALTIDSGDARARELRISLTHNGVTTVLHDAIASPPYLPEDPRPVVTGEIDATFDDEAPSRAPRPPAIRTVDQQLDAVGTFKPDGVGLAVFDGMDIAGTWTLRIQDPGLYPDDRDALTAFSLNATLFRGTCASEPRTAGVCGDLNPVTDPATGHRYAVVDEPLSTWEQARQAATNLMDQGVRGHLVTITSAEEQAFLDANITWDRYWIGAYQNRSAADYAEPDGGWRWVTGETYSYTHYGAGQPNEFGDVGEDWLASNDDGTWSDEPRSWTSLPSNRGFVVEFSETCTAETEVCDGRDNDCDNEIDEGVCNRVLGPVQNPANGHWYEVVEDVYPAWELAREDAETRTHGGETGHLATITSAGEQAWILANLKLDREDLYWLGAFQDAAAPNYAEPSGGWRWVTGENYEYTHYEAGDPDGIEENNPNGANTNVNYIGLRPNGFWRDAGETPGAMLVEYGTEPVAGPCQPLGSTPVCDDGDPCTADVCTPVPNCTDGEGPTNGGCYTCVSSAVAPNTPDVCNGIDDDCDGETDNGAGIASQCDDGNACTVDVCGGTAGCLYTDEVDCNDGILCTLDSCDPMVGCTHATDDTACNDGISCSYDSCDAVEGCINTAQDARCNDLEGCTTDTCDLSLGCVNAPDDLACDDGIACTSDVCTSDGGCGNIADNSACDDANPCTADVCVPGFGCQHTAAVAPCDDGDACTVSDACVDGECVGGAPQVCNDDTFCTIDFCDPATGCQSEPEPGCVHPGSEAGEYVGTVTITGEQSHFEYRPQGNPYYIQHRGPYECVLTLTGIVDRSRGPHFTGSGHGSCTAVVFGGAVVSSRRFEVTHSSNFVGADGKLEGTITIPEFLNDDDGRTYPSASVQWGPEIVVAADGEASATETGGVHSRSYYFGTAMNGQFNSRIGGVLGDPTVSAELMRVPRDGSCCGPEPLGCEPKTDVACNALGFDFIDPAIGNCFHQYGGQSLLRTKFECDLLGRFYYFNSLSSGACCASDGSCLDSTSIFCRESGGGYQEGASCEDANSDGFADTCSLPGAFGRTALSDCAVDGGTLDCDIGGVAALPLEGTWTPTANGFVSATPVAVPVPGSAGRVVFPNVNQVAVVDNEVFEVSGSSGLPDFSEVVALAGVFLNTTNPDFDQLSWGQRFGWELLEMGIEMPVADARSYMFFHADTGIGMQLNDQVSFEAAEGNRADIVFDPYEPAYAISLGGTIFEAVSANLVKSIGFGLATAGSLTIKSEIDLFDGADFREVIATGHLWRSGEFAVIPIPGMPVNFFLKGELLVDAGSALDVITPLAESLIAGDLVALGDGLAAAGRPGTVNDVLAGLKLAGNANSVTFDAKFIEVELGRAAFAFDDGRLSFAGETDPPFFNADGDLDLDGDFDTSGAAGFIDAIESLSFTNTTRFWGYVEGTERLVMSIEADAKLGPVSATGVRVTVDTDEGVSIGLGAVSFDLEGFLKTLASLNISCEGAGTAASCSFAGFEIGSIGLRRGAASYFLDVTIAVPVLGEVAFSSSIRSDGQFMLTGSATLGIPGFVSNNTRVTVSSRGFGVSTRITQLGTNIEMTGEIGLNSLMNLRGRGSIGVLGFTLADARFQMTEAGLSATARMNVMTGQSVSVAFSASGSSTWSLEGTGTLAPFGYQLGQVTVSASSATNKLTLSGEVGIHNAKARLSGDITPTSFELSGTADLVVGGFRLFGAQVTLRNTGLRIAAGVDVLGARFAIQGAIATNGDFALASTANVSVPIGGGLSLNMGAELRKEGDTLRLGGSGSASFLGLSFASRFSVASNGNFEFAARASFSKSIDIGISTLSVSGSVDLSISKQGSRLDFYAAFAGEACATTVFGNVCIGTGGSISSSGEICLEFPVVGYQCIDVD